MTNQEIIDYIKSDYPIQKDVYLWSTFILPDGTFVLPENDNDDYLNDMYEHANIIGGVADNCFDGEWFQAEQWLEQNCVKGNANYPYLHFPKNPTNKQYWAAEDYMNGVQGGFDLNFDIFGAMDDVQDMGCPFYVSLYGKDGRAYDLDIYKPSEIIDRIKKSRVSGVLEESVGNNMIKIKFTDYAEPYMRGAIYEMESDFAPHERDWNNDGEVYTDLLAVFKLVDREGNVDRFGPKPPNKLPLTKGAYDDLLRSGQIQIVGSEVQQKDYKKMAIDYLNNLTMESLLKENTLEEFGPYSISAGYTKTIKWGTVGLFDVEYKDRTLYISDWIESEEELKYKVDKAITKINTLKESLERVMKFTVVAYNKDADTYVDLFTTEDVHEAIVEAEKNAYLCLRDRLRDKDGEPFDWIEVVDERDKVYWASYDDFVPEVGAILTRERFDALVSNGDKTGHLATPSHNFIYYPDRGIVVTDRANPKKSTTIHIDDVKKGYEHIRDIDADKVLTESFRKGLNEGPGAGYTIKSKGYNMQGSVSDVVSVVYTDKGYVIKALCDFVGKVKEFRADSYYSGTGDVDNLPIHCDSFEIRIPLSNDEVIEEITNGAKQITKDNIDASYLSDAVLDVLYTSECSFVYGGGYTHSKYDGQVNDYAHLNYDPYYFDDIKATIYLTNQEDIDKVDRMTQGYGYETIYSVIDDDYDVVDSFDNEEDAIVYAKENGYNEVRADYQYEEWDGNIDIDEGETVWSSDMDESLKEGGPGSGDRRTAAQRYNDRANKIFQGKKNLDRAQAEYLRRLGVSEKEIIDLTNRDRLQVKLIELGEKDNFYNKYDFKSGVLKESSNENSQKVKLTMNNFDSYEGGDTASYTVDNVDTIKPYIIDIGYKTTFKFSDDLYQIKQDDIKKVEVVAMTQDDIYRTDVDVQVYIDIDDNMDLIYCGTYTDSNDVKDVAMVEKIVNDWMRTGKTVKTIKEEFMMEDTMKKDYNKLFEEFLDLIEFTLVKYEDSEFGLIDRQGGNLGNIEERRYTDATQILDDLDIYIDDYIFDPLIDNLKDAGIQSSYSDYRILRYRDELPDSEWDFDVLDMIANHADEIDLEKVEHNGFLPVEESLKEKKDDYDTIKLQLIDELNSNALELNDEECDIDAAVEYIIMTREYNPEYSVEDWVNDTLDNYPECFLESFKENVDAQNNNQINNFTSWNDAYDVFISIVDKYLPDENRVQAEVEKFYLENKSNPFVKEAYRRWMDEDHIDSNLEESAGNVVDTVYDVNTLDYEDDKLYKRNIEHYDTYTDYDEALEVYKELSHESFYPHVELCQVDVYEDGHRDYKVLKSTYGNELVEDFDQEQDTAWTKDEICAEIKSLTSNFTVNNGEAKTFFDEEKDFAVACLEENGYTVTADKQGGKWVIVYKKQVKEHVAVDRYDQLNKDNAKGVIQINATPSGKVLKENAEDYKATLLADTKKAVERDKKLLDVARREAANDPKHKAYYDKMIADLESHISYNEERIEKLSKEETKVDFADSMNSRTFDSAMSYRDIENRKALEDADKVKPDIVRKGQPGYDNLEYAAMIATEKSPRGFTYTLGDTYLDFGSGWQWTTLIADKNNGRDSYQALNQVEWEEIANAESNEVIDRVIDNMFKDQYCPDRISRRVESVEDALLRLDMMD